MPLHEELIDIFHTFSQSDPFGFWTTNPGSIPTALRQGAGNAQVFTARIPKSLLEKQRQLAQLVNKAKFGTGGFDPNELYLGRAPSGASQFLGTSKDFIKQFLPAAPAAGAAGISGAAALGAGALASMPLLLGGDVPKTQEQLNANLGNPAERAGADLQYFAEGMQRFLSGGGLADPGGNIDPNYIPPPPGTTGGRGGDPSEALRSRYSSQPSFQRHRAPNPRPGRASPPPFSPRRVGPALRRKSLAKPTPRSRRVGGRR